MLEVQMKHSFPLFFAVYKLPPEEAKEESIEVYRACRTGLDANSFQPTYIENGYGTSLEEKKEDPGEYSLSVFMNPKDVKRFMDVTRGYDPPYSCIAHGYTDPDYGVCERTQDRKRREGKKERLLMLIGGFTKGQKRGKHLKRVIWRHCMDDERLLKSTGICGGLELQCVLLESNYPVIFSCTDQENQVYFGICCERTGAVITWIIARTTYSVLIRLLQDKITIRNAFLFEENTKYVVLFDRKREELEVKSLRQDQIPDDYLPNPDAYMNSERGEFDEEIELYCRMCNRQAFKQKHTKYIGQLKEKSKNKRLETKGGRDNDYRSKGSGRKPAC